MLCKSSYLGCALRPDLRKEVIRLLVERMTSFGLDKFDTIVFRGMSGTLIAPSVADILGKNMVVVRKSDGSHSSYVIEGFMDLKNYVIIDDLIFSGSTVRTILESIHTWNPKCETINPPEYNCVHIFLYAAARQEEFIWRKNDSDADAIMIPVDGFFIGEDGKVIG